MHRLQAILTRSLSEIGMEASEEAAVLGMPCNQCEDGNAPQLGARRGGRLRWGRGRQIRRLRSEYLHCWPPKNLYSHRGRCPRLALADGRFREEGIGNRIMVMDACSPCLIYNWITRGRHICVFPPTHSLKNPPFAMGTEEDIACKCGDDERAFRWHRHVLFRCPLKSWVSMARTNSGVWNRWYFQRAYSNSAWTLKAVSTIGNYIDGPYDSLARKVYLVWGSTLEEARRTKSVL